MTNHNHRLPKIRLCVTLCSCSHSTFMTLCVGTLTLSVQASTANATSLFMYKSEKLSILSFRILSKLFVCFWRDSPPVGPGPPHSRGFSITHDAPQSVRLLWVSDMLVAETSSSKHTTLTTNVHPTAGIRTHILTRRAAADPSLRPRGHWDRHISN